MKIPSVKGTRDFYPLEMAVRNFIVDGWKAASIRNGFEEYDGPIFEYLDMYRIKSGDEIVEQLFNLTDRGGRELAIRPEITPTLARMVNQRINALAKPIKWFSVPRLCRAERPQKGRLREFFQWNVDIMGVDDVLADAETIFCAVDYLRQVGLTQDDIVVKISSRKMLAALLQSIGIAPSQLDPLYAVLDKKNKIPAESFEQVLAETISDSKQRQKVGDLMAVTSIDALGSFVSNCETSQAGIDELKRLFKLLDVMGIGGFCEFDIGIVRGLAYYTGIVYEIFDKAGQLRAIGGGGRYDNLLKQFGGPGISATGFGIGDCVLAILLEEKGLLKPDAMSKTIDYYVAHVSEEYLPRTIEIAMQLRQKGRCTEFSYKSTGLGKQLKAASAMNAAHCVIVGEEIENDQIVLKNMAEGEQKTVDLSRFLAEI